LDQNYPNPFNASTVIKFNTRHDGHVRLDVYNILGQKVITLVDEFRNFGPQAADWDGTDVVGRAVPTGLYFYRLTTADYTSVKKMVLLK
jgi:flagellar hook assembly protein FlgD